MRQGDSVMRVAEVADSIGWALDVPPWFPCMDCARPIVQSGIVTLVCVKPDLRDLQWGDDFADVPFLLKEGGVSIRWWRARSGPREMIMPDL